MADRFEDLRNYVAVVANGGVNAAAETLGIAKSAVSRRLAELETRLGVTLIDRTTRRLELTAVGRDYHRRAAAILASLDDLDRDVGGDANTAAAIKVVADRDLIPRLIAPSVATFLSVQEGVTVELLALSPDAAGPSDCDVLITSSPQAHAADERKDIREIRRLTCAAPSYLAGKIIPTSRAAMAEHPWISVEGAGPHGVGEVAAVLVVPDAEAALAATIAGAGLADLPDHVAGEAIARGDLTAIRLDREPGAEMIVASFARDCAQPVRRLVDHLAATLKVAA